MNFTATVPHIVFSGGGTAGHLFPGLAVAEQLVRHAPQTRITFAGTGKPFERQRVEAAGFAYLTIPSRPFPRRPHEAFRFVADNVKGFYMSIGYLREQEVSLVVGLGGYASVPMARAALRRQLPLVLLEQNAVPGRATRWLSNGAMLVCSAFDEVRSQLRNSGRVRVTGNPIRRGLSQLSKSPHWPRHAQSADRRRRRSALGGSGGAKALNEQVPLALYKAGAAIQGWHIVHQSGERDVAATTELYGKMGLQATVVPFIQDMPRTLLHTDFVVSRAGGTTLAELAAAAVPAILVPYPHATDNHQRKNADVFTATGASLTIDQRDLSGRLDDHLAAAILKLTGDNPLRRNMSDAMWQRARPHAAKTVAKAIDDLVLANQLFKAA